MGFHLMFGLFVATLLLLFHSVPAFVLGGVIATIVDSLRGEEDAEVALTTLLALRRGLLRQSMIVVGVVLCGSVIGLAQVRQSVPTFVHGGVMAAVTLMHILNWQRMDRVMRSMRRIFYDLEEAFGEDDPDSETGDDA